MVIKILQKKASLVFMICHDPFVLSARIYI